jgi:hypothetical protein
MSASAPASITVQVTPDLARATLRGPPAGEQPALDALDALHELARELGVAFRPMHPDTDDATLRAYFTVDVPNGASAERVAARLRDSPVIAAAYVKPPDAMP